MVTISEDQAIERLRQACEREGGQKAWARKHGVSEQYVSDVLNGRRDLGKSILSPLGLVRCTFYEDVE